MGGSYDVHGVGLEIRSEDSAVLETMELRLRDFAIDVPRPTDISLEFVIDGENGGASPAGCGRPVYDTPHGSLHYYPDADALHGRLGNVWLHCEPQRGCAWLHSAAFADTKLYLATHPLATISLMELLERLGLFSLHAACLADHAGQGVLLSGPSGSGKSTLSLALARAGMSFLSDDTVFLAPASQDDQRAVRVLGFADTIGLPDYAAERFGELRSRLAPQPAPGFPKRLGRIEELFGVNAIRVCEPRVLLLPEVSQDGISRIDPLDPGEALLRLVPDVLLTEPVSTQAHLAAIGSLLHQVECYTLHSGQDLERTAELIASLV